MERLANWWRATGKRAAVHQPNFNFSPIAAVSCPPRSCSARPFHTPKGRVAGGLPQALFFDGTLFTLLQLVEQDVHTAPSDSLCPLVKTQNSGRNFRFLWGASRFATGRRVGIRYRAACASSSCSGDTSSPDCQVRKDPARRPLIRPLPCWLVGRQTRTPGCSDKRRACFNTLQSM
jgi:hypothetical protein